MIRKDMIRKVLGEFKTEKRTVKIEIKIINSRKQAF